jgi:YVTN family beta-propeller protein
LNSKILSTKTTSSIFLAIVPIVVGTITALSSLLFMIGVEDVQAQDLGPTELLVGGAPTGIAHDPVNGQMYVTNQHDDTVHVIDTATNEIIREIPVGDAPTGIAFDSVNGQMYVTNQHDNTVHVININNGDINNGLIDRPGDN